MAFGDYPQMVASAIIQEPVGRCDRHSRGMRVALSQQEINRSIKILPPHQDVYISGLPQAEMTVRGSCQGGALQAGARNTTQPEQLGQPLHLGKGLVAE